MQPSKPPLAAAFRAGREPAPGSLGPLDGLVSVVGTRAPPAPEGSVSRRGALAVLRRQPRRRFLLRTGRGQPIQAHIRKWLAGRRFPAQLRLQIDVDPQSFL